MSHRRGEVPVLVPAMIWLPILGLLAVAWPYLLGTWLAVELGAANPSSSRSTAGWAMQVLGVGAAVLLWRRHRSRTASERDAAALADLDDALACARHLAHQLRVAPKGTAAPVPRPGKRLLFSFDEGGLVEHRARARGADRQATVVAQGRVEISDVGVHFIGPEKIVTWPMRDVIEVRQAADYVYLPLTSRKAISGVTVGQARHQALILAVRWVEAVSEGARMDDVAVRAGELVKSLTVERDAAAALTGSPTQTP